MTSPLPRERSTPELRRHLIGFSIQDANQELLVGPVGLEPTKLSQLIYSQPPLPLGTRTQVC